MRREREWAWWAPLVGMLVVSALILLRIPLLGAGLTGSVGAELLWRPLSIFSWLAWA